MKPAKEKAKGKAKSLPGPKPSTRIREHLIKVCSKVPEEIREKARESSSSKKARVSVVTDANAPRSSMGEPEHTNPHTQTSSMGDPDMSQALVPVPFGLEGGPPWNNAPRGLSRPLSPFNWTTLLKFGSPSQSTQLLCSVSNVHTLMDIPGMPPSNVPSSIYQRPIEELVGESFVNLAMCLTGSADVSDVIKDSNCIEFFRMVRQHSIPEKLFTGDPFTLKRSTLSIEEEINLNTWEVQESWKESGCTLLVFNPDEITGKFSNTCVIGIYSPRGIVFFEIHKIVEISDELKRRFQSFDFDFDFDIVKHMIHHRMCYGISVEKSMMKKNWVGEDTFQGKRFSCLRLLIQDACVGICKGSAWADSLILRAEKVHKALAKLQLGTWLSTTLHEKSFPEFACRGFSSPVLSFLAIFMLEDEVKSHLTHQFHVEESVETRGELKEILDDLMFWAEGGQLKRVLLHILKIPILMDTLVPAVGYLRMAVDKVICTLANDALRPMPNDPIWPGLSQLRSVFEVDKGAAYLNPVYFLLKDEASDLKEETLSTLLHLVKEEERQKIVDELQLYHDRCSEVFRCKNDHPVQLWKKYGNCFPLLQRYAIMILSQPISCMCNQLRKPQIEIGGESDNHCIMSLNWRMMKEFKKLGDDIYKPIDMSEL